MYYIGFLKPDPLKYSKQRIMVFWSDGKPTQKQFPYLLRVEGPYGSEQDARNSMYVMKQAYGYVENPAKSERQRRFMCAELGRKRAGKKTVTGMKESQLRDFCRKSNPEVLHAEIRDKHTGLVESAYTGATVADVVRWYKEHGVPFSKVKWVGNGYTYRHNLKNPGEGYYVMRWGGGRYTSVAWYKTKAEAQKEVDRIKMIGAWSGMPPKVESARRDNPKHDRVISHKQALALTKKVIAYGKKLFKHEQLGVKRNPGEEYHKKKFLAYLRELDKYKVGSQPYISTLAKAYEHLESAKASIEEGVR